MYEIYTVIFGYLLQKHIPRDSENKTNIVKVFVGKADFAVCN
jgi:hypothetical protein